MTPPSVSPPEAITGWAVGFVRALRQADLDVTIHSSITLAEAIAEVGLDSETGVYWAGRAVCVHRPEDIPVYDRIFRRYWKGSGGHDQVVLDDVVTLAVDAEADEGNDDDAAVADDAGEFDGPVVSLRWSSAEQLRRKDFSSYTDAELVEAHRLMADLQLIGAARSSRRPLPSKRLRGRPDLRRTVRHALGTGGEPIRRAFTTTGDRPRRVVLLIDVSGSMEPYARALLRFVHAAVVARRRVEAFALGTRLTRMTRELSTHDPDEALRRAAEIVHDFSGGTRLGEGLRLFNDEWGQRGMARGAVVVIMSDGWDRGDPEQLAEQMRRLGRVAHRVVWVNPLKATDGYAPLARGMAAALPYVDEFIEGHSLDALQNLADVIAY